MTQDFDALTDRKLDALVAEDVMGWKYRDGGGLGGWCNPKGDLDVIRHYSTDDNAARIVRNKIAELGLEANFVVACLDMYLLCDRAPPAWAAMQITPRQQCIAALKCVTDAKKKEQ